MKIIEGILIVIGVLVLSLAALYAYHRNDGKVPTPTEADTSIFCTQDVRQCSDGSYVSRQGPRCEFAECPFVPERPGDVDPSDADDAKADQDPTADSTDSTSPSFKNPFAKEPVVEPEPVLVRYSAQGFAPETITIKKGAIVEFKNASNSSFWPASDDHPDHLIYPEFDAGLAIDTGGKYRFTFTKVGTWTYHNHLNPNHQGIITVTP